MPIFPKGPQNNSGESEKEKVLPQPPTMNYHSCMWDIEFMWSHRVFSEQRQKWLLQEGGAGHTDQERQNKENYPLPLGSAGENSSSCPVFSSLPRSSISPCENGD